MGLTPSDGLSASHRLFGVRRTLQPDFAKLVGKAKLWICDVSFRGNGYHGREEEVLGVGYKDFAT
jgi:hypothetical protein